MAVAGTGDRRSEFARFLRKPEQLTELVKLGFRTQSLDGSGLQEFMRQSFDPARPVAVNIIDFGSDSDRATWEAVAQISGGQYRNLPTSTSPELTSAIATFLG